MGTLQDYTIEHQNLDWHDILAPWAWLLPREFTLWIMNRFGDLFLILDDDSIHLLDVGCGSLEKVATSREDFALQIDAGKAEDWLMIPLVDQLTAEGIMLQEAQSYSYKQLPILGGDYTVENTKVAKIDHHYKAFGVIHEAIKDLPDGTRVRFRVDG
ncbi:MAG TPA: T6SS immunity protein Tdi1 domain-containing protein [Terriglobia bacterium]|nr:T6SS immunity protein Tdi1 domain-containing protein [Terriglobia bacterium]